MDLSTRVHSGWTICSVSGDITIFATSTFREYLLAALDTPRPRLLVDLSAVTSMDAGGLGVLVLIRRKALRAGGTLRLLAPTQLLQRLLKSTGLAAIFDVSLDLPAAREAERMLVTVS